MHILLLSHHTYATISVTKFNHMPMLVGRTISAHNGICNLQCPVWTSLPSIYFIPMRKLQLVNVYKQMFFIHIVIDTVSNITLPGYQCVVIRPLLFHCLSVFIVKMIVRRYFFFLPCVQRLSKGLLNQWSTSTKFTLYTALENPFYWPGDFEVMVCRWNYAPENGRD